MDNSSYKQNQAIEVSSKIVWARAHAGALAETIMDE